MNRQICWEFDGVTQKFETHSLPLLKYSYALLPIKAKLDPQNGLFHKPRGNSGNFFMVHLLFRGCCFFPAISVANKRLGRPNGKLCKRTRSRGEGGWASRCVGWLLGGVCLKVCRPEERGRCRYLKWWFTMIHHCKCWKRSTKQKVYKLTVEVAMMNGCVYRKKYIDLRNTSWDSYWNEPFVGIYLFPFHQKSAGGGWFFYTPPLPIRAFSKGTQLFHF